MICRILRCVQVVSVKKERIVTDRLQNLTSMVRVGVISSTSVMKILDLWILWVISKEEYY